MKDLIAKRQANMKFFKNEDASITATVYKKPVHFMKDGQWKDIDNTLVLKGDCFENTENEVGVKLAAMSGTKQPLVQMELEGHKVYWNLLGEKKVGRG